LHYTLYFYKVKREFFIFSAAKMKWFLDVPQQPSCPDLPGAARAALPGQKKPSSSHRSYFFSAPGRISTFSIPVAAHKVRSFCHRFHTIFILFPSFAPNSLQRA
jgi:hypothetical protein